MEGKWFFIMLSVCSVCYSSFLGFASYLEKENKKDLIMLEKAKIELKTEELKVQNKVDLSQEYKQ